MGRRGPAPRPTRLKQLLGNPGRRPPPEGEVGPPPGDGFRCPCWLHPFAKAKWRQLAPKLLALGLLSELDGECLALACQAWADWRVATERLNAEGLTVQVGPQLQPHPCVALAKAAWDRWRKASALFGLSPSDRTRVKASAATPEAADPFEELLNGAGERNDN